MIQYLCLNMFPLSRDPNEKLHREYLTVLMAMIVYCIIMSGVDPIPPILFFYHSTLHPTVSWLPYKSHPFYLLLYYTIFIIPCITYSQSLLSHPTESKSSISSLYFISLLIPFLTITSIYNRFVYTVTSIAPD